MLHSFKLQIEPTIPNCTKTQRHDTVKMTVSAYILYSAIEYSSLINLNFGPKIFLPSGSVGRVVTFESKGSGFDSPLGFLKVWAKISIRGRILIHSFPEPLGIK